MFDFIRNLGRPHRTEEMSRNGLTWAKLTDGQWHEVCDFCGGNCGQCGMTGRIGNVGFDMNRMARKVGAR